MSNLPAGLTSRQGAARTLVPWHRISQIPNGRYRPLGGSSILEVVTSADSDLVGRLDWRARLVSILLGAAGGMAINLISDDAGYRGVAGAATFAALLVAASRLRRFPKRAPAVRYGIRALLALSLFASFFAVMGPASLAPYAVLAAAGFTVAAVMIPSNSPDAFRILTGSASVALGVASVSFGFLIMGEGLHFFGGATSFSGVALFCYGIGNLLNDDRVCRVAWGAIKVGGIFYGLALELGDVYIRAVVEFAISAVLFGVTVALFFSRVKLFLGTTVAVSGLCITYVGITLASFAPHRAAALIGLGVAVAGVGFTYLFRLDIVESVTRIGIGLTTCGLGLSLGPGSDLFDVWVFIGIGICNVGVGVASLTRFELSVDFALVGLGIAGICAGVAALARGAYVSGVPLVGIGIANVGAGFASIIDSDEGNRVREWLTALTREPGQPLLPNQQPRGLRG